LEIFETLDVGCGATPRGDVNIDLFPNNKEQSILPYDPKRIKNFIKADAENLPFRDKTFKKVYAIHVLEHLKNPFKALNEWKRVAKIILIRLPSAYDPDKTKTHLYTWNISTLENLLYLVFSDVNVHYTRKRIKVHGRLSKYIPLLQLLTKRFPKEIEAICWG